MRGNHDMWTMHTADWVVLSLTLAGWAFLAWYLWRHPGFRRAMVDHWCPSAVAARIDRWVQQQKR